MAPGLGRGPSIGRRRAGVAFMCAKKRCDVARSLRPTFPMRPPPSFPVAALPVGHPRVSLPAGRTGLCVDLLPLPIGCDFNAPWLGLFGDGDAECEYPGVVAGLDAIGVQSVT